jgi:hypothetical protein
MMRLKEDSGTARDRSRDRLSSYIHALPTTITTTTFVEAAAF